MAIPAEDAYWRVSGSLTQVWSSAQKAYVPLNNAAYLVWLASGRTTIDIVSEANLNQVYADLGLGELAPANIDDEVRGVDVVTLKIAFNHENRIRALEGQAPRTLAQFKAVLRTLLN